MDKKARNALHRFSSSGYYSTWYFYSSTSIGTRYKLAVLVWISTSGKNTPITPKPENVRIHEYANECYTVEHVNCYTSLIILVLVSYIAVLCTTVGAFCAVTSTDQEITATTGTGFL
jgi:hypothetical protein